MKQAALHNGNVRKAEAKAPLRTVCAVLGTAAFVMVMGPAEGFAQQSKSNVPAFMKPQVTINACKFPDGRLKPVHGCTSTGPVSETTMAEAGKIITDREQFLRCQHGTRRIEGGYTAPRTVGWGSLVESAERKKAGNCPSGQALQAWFMQDLTSSYTRAVAQARTMKSSNACIVRSLTVMNHQLGDVARKYPDTWKKLQAGQLCNVLETILAWSWYQHSCDRTLDTVIALNSVKECMVGEN